MAAIFGQHIPGTSTEEGEKDQLIGARAITRPIEQVGQEAVNFVDRNLINPIDSALNGSRNEGPGALQQQLNAGQQNRERVKTVNDLQNSLTGEAAKFAADIPKNKQMLVGAADAATYGDVKQQERMQRSQAVAKGQAGSGIAKLRLANLSAGAKYAHIRAESEISQKLRQQSEAMSSQAIQSAQSIAGMSMDQAQRQYDLDFQNLKNQNAALSQIGGAAGYGIGSYLARPEDTSRATPTLSNGYSQNYTMPGYAPGTRGLLGGKDLGLGGTSNG